MTREPPAPGTTAPRVTAADVARRSGVSRATVSYVLNNVAGQTIPEATRERVRSAAADLGYVPSAAAASLRRGHSRLVLVVTDSAMSGAVTEPFLVAIRERLTAAGHVALTHQVSAEDALLALVHEIRPYGVLALAALSPTALAEISAAGVPSVYSSAQGDPSFPRPWEREIGTLQAEHLLARGRDALVYASPTSDQPRAVIARAREEGVAAACSAAGVDRPIRVELPTDRDTAARALREALPATGRIGVVAFDDSLAAVALAGLAELGLDVPGDVAVIGVDDAPFAPFLSPALTTVSIDGALSGTLLAERFLRGEPGPREASHALATIIVRAST